MVFISGEKSDDNDPPAVAGDTGGEMCSVRELVQSKLETR
ncbi:hypothetical protein FB471_1035 [Amycolatopsis cihanbeyliensis]|uniref:Uncharacterized protein n=1 Tax=Amycolatopsis cihanbeyliensis TaxID=1128664 RepID=A0A542DE56_AMYCI|nr:hypothetical protein FB471_1035 [Amycolatopsis cihanbeyliensis]